MTRDEANMLMDRMQPMFEEAKEKLSFASLDLLTELALIVQIEAVEGVTQPTLHFSDNGSVVVCHPLTLPI